MADTHDVALTVTDSALGADTVTHPWSVATAATGQVAFVGATHSNPASARFKSVTVPAGAHAGDRALLAFTRASTVAWTGPTGVTGWTEVASTTANGLVSTIHTRALHGGTWGARFASTPPSTPRRWSRWPSTPE